MAFTRGWDNAAPPGTRNANEIDSAIQEVRQDLDERFAAKLFTTPMPNTTVEADVVVKPEILGNATKTLLIGPHILTNRQDEHDTTHQEEYVQLDGTQAMQGSFSLPAGCTITGFEATINSVSGVLVTVELYSTGFLTGTKASISIITRSLASIGQCSASGVLAFPVTADTLLFIRLVGNGPRAYGFRVTYTVPNCSVTL